MTSALEKDREVIGEATFLDAAMRALADKRWPVAVRALLEARPIITDLHDLFDIVDGGVYLRCYTARLLSIIAAADIEE